MLILKQAALQHAADLKELGASLSAWEKELKKVLAGLAQTAQNAAYNRR